MQQFGASAFYTVVRWHKLGEVNDEYTLHISSVLAICVPKIIKFGGDLTKFWQKQFGSFLTHPVHSQLTRIITYLPLLIMYYLHIYNFFLF